MKTILQKALAVSFFLTVFVAFTSTTVFAALSGSYTINPSGTNAGSNYTTFTLAVTDLVSGGRNGPGVSGAVTFTVSNGTYNEQVTINPITGASSSNTITFDGGAGNAANVVLKFDGSTNGSDYAVLTLYNTSYVRINNISVTESSATTNGWGICILGSQLTSPFADNNKIQNCIVNMPVASSSLTDLYGIALTGNQIIINNLGQFTNNTISGCTVNNGYIGIQAYGSANNVGNVISNNTVTNSFFRGIEIDGLGGSVFPVKIQNNTVTTGVTAIAIGIYVANSVTTSATDWIEISGNIIPVFTQTGIRVACSGSATTQAVRVFNNFVGGNLSGAQAAANARGILIAGSYIHLWSNSVCINMTTTVTALGAFDAISTSLTNLDIRNNIFACTATGNAATYVPFYYTAATLNSTFFAAFDYNQFYNASATNEAIIGGTTYTNSGGTNIVGASGFNSNSVVANPNFDGVSGNNYLHITSLPTGCKRGVNISTVTTDIDGQTRASAPNIGADELIVSVSPASATICSGGPQTLTATAGTPWSPFGYTWSPTSGATGSTYSATPASSTTYTVSAIDANSCTVVQATSALTTMSCGPTVYNMSGNSSSASSGLTLCASGLTLGMMNADIGVVYNLIQGASTVVSTNTPSVAGAFNFSYTPVAGFTYTVTGSSGSTSAMNGSVTVITTPPVPSTPSGTSTRCQGSGNDTYTTSSAGATSYTWSVTTPNFITGSTSSGSVTWNSGYSGTATVSVTATNTCGTSTAGTASVTVTAGSLSTPAAPSGSTSICTGSGPLTYTTGAVTNATSYTWSVTAAAGSVSGTGTSATVTWTATYTGTASVSVAANGSCGNSSAASTSVYVNSMNGTYTIDNTVSGANNLYPVTTTFNSFNSAVAALACGVSGPVTFNVTAHTYNEQVTINPITGASSSNTITFDGGAGNAANVVLKFDGSTNGSDYAVLTLYNTSYVRINNISVTESSATTNGWGICILGSQLTSPFADNNKIQNCIVNMPVASSSLTDLYGIALTGNQITINNLGQFTNNTISGCTVNNGYIGIQAYGSANNVGNVISNNTVTNSFFRGIEIDGLGGSVFPVKIQNNTVTTGVTAIAIGIYVANSVTTSATDWIEISGNIIPVFTQTGIRVACSGSATTQAVRVFNNFVGGNLSGAQAAANARGILIAGSYIHLWSNSVCINMTTTVTALGAFDAISTSLTNLDIRNNIFACTATGNAATYVPFYYTAATLNSTFFAAFNYNIFYNASATNEAIVGGANYTDGSTGTSIIGASGFNGASYVTNPNFDNNATTNYLHVSSQCFGRGIQIATVTTDIDGQTRVNPPTIGADEIPLVLTPGTPTTPSGTTTRCVGSGTSVFTTTASGASTYAWSITGTGNSVSGTGSSATVTWSAAFVGTATVSVTGTNSCGTTSPASVVVTVNGLNGAYTIDNSVSGAANLYPNTNVFNSFASAVAAMSCGVGGPVLFNVNAGTGSYHEQVVVPAVPNTSSTNTVTFDGGTGNAATRIVTFDGSTNVNNYAVFSLYGTAWIRVKNLTINETSATPNGWGICILSEQPGGNSNPLSDDDMIQNCIVNMPAGSATNNDLYGIAISSSQTTINTPTDFTNITIDGCTVNNGTSGIAGYIWSFANGSVFSNNTLANGYNRGIEFTGAGLLGTPLVAIKIKNNKITTNTTNTTNRGISLSGTLNPSSTDNIEISGNVISSFGSFGIVVSAGEGSSTERLRIANNFIGGNISSAFTGFASGIQCKSSFVDLWFNSININVATTATNFAAFVATVAQTNLSIRNNIFAETSASAVGVPFYYNAGALNATNFDAFDNNIFYSAAGTSSEAIIGGTTYTSSTLIGTGGFNNSSVISNPYFDNNAATNYLHITFQCVRGVQITAITTDIDVQTRNNPPNIGADEIPNIPANSTPAIVTNNPAAVCSPSTVDLTAAAVTSGTNPATSLTFTYWTDPGATISYATPTTAGAGTYYVVGTAAGGCSAISGPVTVTVHAAPTPSVSPTSSVCAGSVGNIYSTQGGESDYLWSVSGGSTTGGGGTSNASVTVTWGASGTGHVKINYTDGNGCTAVSQTDQSIIINANPTPSITEADNSGTANNDNIICNLDAATLGVSSYSVYSWSPVSASTQSITVTPSTTSTYTLVITDSNGCTGSTTKAITVNQLPPLVVTPNNAVCTGGTTATLTASGASTYTWLPTTNLTPGAGTSAIETAQISALTIYTVTGTDGNKCSASTQVPVATVAVGGAITPLYSIICSGGTQTLTVTGAAGNDYQWQMSSDNINWGNVSGATNTIYTTTSGNGNTNKFYRLLANSNACWNVASTTAEVDVSNTTIIVAASSVTDNTLVLNWSPVGSGNYNITYSGASSGLQTGVTPPKTITGLTANGGYNFVVTQTGVTGGCSATGTLNVNTLCAVPTNLTATPLTVGSTQELNVGWNGPAGNYRVFYRPLYSAVTFYTKDVTNATSVVLSKQGNNNLYGSNTYQIYVSSLDCPNPGNLGQATSSIYVTTNPTAVPGCSTPIIDTAFSTCPVELEVQLHGGSGVYNVYIQRLTPTLQAVNSYGITGGDFVINAAAGQQYLISADSKCGSTVSTLNIWHNTLTVKPTCTSPSNLVLSNPTCHGFTASWNADQCISNTVSGYDLYMRQVGSINYNSYGVALSVAPVGPHELVNWLGAGKNMQVFVQSVYSCGGAVTYGPSSQTVTITTQSAGCRDEEPTDQLQENKPAVQQYSADNQEVFSLYPNPNTGEFTVDLSRLSNNTDEVRIEVINMIGQTLITRITGISDGHMSEFINLPNGTAAGTYIVRLTAGKNVYTAKMNISR